LVFADPPQACSTAARLGAGEMEGAVVVVTRGRCSFLEKADTVSTWGGSAVAVVDYPNGDGLHQMDAIGKATIPAVMVSAATGEQLHKLADTHWHSPLVARLVASSACLDSGSNIHRLHEMHQARQEAAAVVAEEEERAAQEQ
ncbi:unnamed protein product, partial [Chrysoparadoxa australica]